MDAVLGKEGITGAICELTLKLIPKPQSQWGIAFFFGSSEDAGRFVDILRLDMPQCEHAKVAAVEYIDRMAMNLIEEHKATMTKIKELPDIGEETQSMVYIELHGDEEEIEILAESLMESAMVCNSDPEEAWAVSSETDVEKMHAFRHGAAETSNLYIEKARQMDARITKLGNRHDDIRHAIFRYPFLCGKGTSRCWIKGQRIWSCDGKPSACKYNS